MLKNHQELQLLKFLPEEVKKLFIIFDDKIRLVGGSVRDLLLQKEVHDFDFATILKPEKIIEILEFNKIKAIATNIKFGTIIAVINNKNFEITTLRRDLETDGRHAVVEFVDDYFFDASRRDFTINALYLDNKGLIYDYFNGIDDLKNQKVKFIGDANLRIEEDFLRILRFFRFSCFYAKSLDLEGLESCIKHKKQLKSLSANRIRDEIFKVLKSDKKESVVQFFESINNSKIAAEIFSCDLQIDNFKNLLNFANTLNIKLKNEIEFFILIYKKDLILENILNNFNFSNHSKKYFKFLFFNLEKYQQLLKAEEIREFLVFEKKEFIYDFYLLNCFYSFDYSKLKDNIKNLEFIQNFIEKKFPLTGQDFIDLGLSGDKIALAIKSAKSFWAKNNFLTSKDELISFVIDFYRSQN